MTKPLLLTLLLTLLATAPAAAQRKAKPAAKARKAVKVEAPEPTAAELLRQEMLGATAAVMFFDSVVVDRADYLRHIPFTNETGRVAPITQTLVLSGTPHNSAAADGNAYVNGYGNLCLFAPADSARCRGMMLTERLAAGWSEPRLLSELGTRAEHPQTPFLLDDGTTLYFTAQGDASLGGHDVFMTTYDGETGRYFAPQNMGLPYNSAADELLLAIDEYDRIGWLVSTRRQPAGKVCIYLFEPTAARVPLNTDGMPEEQVARYADLASIRDTWHFGNRAAALQRLAELQARQGRQQLATAYTLVVNDKKVCRTEADFNNPEARKRYRALCEAEAKQQTLSRTLDYFRAMYAKGNEAERRKLAPQILQMEAEAEQRRAAIEKEENAVRALEVKN